MTWPLAAAAFGSGVIGAFGQASANRANLKMAREQMAFQERMSSTSYQRAVADLEKAGLNPAMAYGQGGASTPTGSAATFDSALEPLSQGVSNAAQTAMEWQSRKAAMDQQKAQTALTRAQAIQLQLESAARLEMLKRKMDQLGASTRLADATSAVRHLDQKYLADTMEGRVQQVLATLGLTGMRAAESGTRSVVNLQQARSLGEQISFLVASREGRLRAIEILNRLNAARADEVPHDVRYTDAREEFTRELIETLRWRRAQRRGKVTNAWSLRDFFLGEDDEQ